MAKSTLSEAEPEVGPGKGRFARAREVPGLTLIAVLVVAVFWPLANLRRLLMTGEVGTIDMLYQTYPFKLALGQAIAHGRLPLWTDRIFCGYPLFANPSVGALYPPNWIFAVLPGPAAMALTIMGACMLAGWLAYYWCRVLGLGRAPATLAGMAYAGCGFFVAHAKHVAFLQSAAFIPLQLALLERAVQGNRRQAVRALLWLAPVTGLQILAGGVPVVYLAVLAVGTYAVLRLLMLAGRGWRFRIAVAALLVVCLAWGAALAGGQLLPTRELSGVSERGKALSIGSADLCPLPARDLLTFGWSRAVGWPGDGSYRRLAPYGRGNFWENYSYLGWPTVLLALGGLPWTLRRSRPARALVGVVLVGLLLGLGIHTGFYYLAYHAVPGMAYFRFPQRFLLFAQLGIAVLGAMGMQRLLARLPGRRGKVVAGAILAVALLDLAWAQWGINVYYDAAAWHRPPATLAQVRERGRVYTYMGNAAYRMQIAQGGVAGNKERLVAARAAMQPDVNMLWDVSQASGYGELTPEWSAMLWHGQHTQSIMDWWETLAGSRLLQRLYQETGRWADFPDPETDPPMEPLPTYVRLLQTWNVAWVASAWPLKAEGLQEVPSGAPLHLYRVADPLPRAFLVPRADRVATQDDVLPLARVGMLDFRRIVYVACAPTAARADFSALPVRVTQAARPERLTLTAEAPAPCWLVVTDTWYPGWTATLDGKPVPVQRANYAMRAVRLPAAGRHTVVMTYGSRSLRLGLGLGLAAAILWLAAAVMLPRWADARAGA